MFLIPQDSWIVKKTKEKGLGVFAAKEILKGTIIGDYTGQVIKTIEYDLEKDKQSLQLRDKNGLYLMYYSDNASIYPDLSKPDIHLINHACSPNCFIYSYRGHTLFFAIRNIKAGEELTISYLLAPKGEDCKKECSHICKCGSNRCTGTMYLTENKYTLWQKFQEEQSKKTKRAGFKYGKNLPKLRSYPKILDGDPIYEVVNKLNNL